MTTYTLVVSALSNTQQMTVLAVSKGAGAEEGSLRSHTPTGSMFYTFLLFREGCFMLIFADRL